VVNDIQKLSKVINSLEEQTSQVMEFNGVLRAVKDARAEIDASNAALASLSNEQKKLIKESYCKLDNFGQRISELENKIIDLEKGQYRVLRTIGDLKILSPDQFEHGREKIQFKLTELNFLTPDQYKDGSRATNEALTILAHELTHKIDQANQAHQASLNSLKAVTALGMLILAGGIAFLAYPLLY